MKIFRNRLVCAFLSLVALRCGAPGDGSSQNSTSNPSGADQLPLGKGSRGHVVRAAYDYLYRYGYFPNADLARSFPHWRPAVPVPLADPNFFDDNMEHALAVFQSNLALPVSKVIDSATVARMQEPRCGHPDVDPSSAARVDKWARGEWENRWNKKNLRYRFEGFSLEQQIAISEGIKAWEEVTSLTFVESNSSDQDFSIVPWLRILVIRTV